MSYYRNNKSNRGSRRPRRTYNPNVAKIGSKLYRRNWEIKAPELRVIDQEEGNLGVLPREEAVKLAKEKELSLIEVSPAANPPVAKILEWSKFLYQEKRKLKETSKKKPPKMKAVRFSPKISEMDRDRKIKEVKRFLKEGHNVQLIIMRKSRVTPPQQREFLQELLTHFDDYNTIDGSRKQRGRNITVTLNSHVKK